MTPEKILSIGIDLLKEVAATVICLTQSTEEAKKFLSSSNSTNITDLVLECSEILDAQDIAKIVTHEKIFIAFRTFIIVIVMASLDALKIFDKEAVRDQVEKIYLRISKNQEITDGLKRLWSEVYLTSEIS